MTMLAADAAPFGGLGALDGVTPGWVPFVQVDDVDGATKRATKLGASVIKARTRGPAGDYAIVRDPGGAAFALWQKA
jgi:predicted enzyme related to lactoylglutathione lyase